LLEDLSLGYVTSGRHVVGVFAGTRPAPGKGLLAVGGVEYGKKGGDGPAGLTPLPGTEIEVQRCQARFRNAFPDERTSLLSGADADEGRVKAACAKNYRYLHLATHGFFETPDRLLAWQRGTAKVADMPPGLHLETVTTLALVPMVRSGLVLARPGKKEADAEDGFLTAEEVSALDLRGTELVVLSACDTGLGDIQAGEGMLGLQRAFQAAGAQTVVASLWRVDDAATTFLMEEYYRNLWEKKLSKLEALRQAQLRLLREPEELARRTREMSVQLAERGLEFGPPKGRREPVAGRRSPPAVWAAFILTGDMR
jgi:CHAT domain-containing protein